MVVSIAHQKDAEDDVKYTAASAGGGAQTSARAHEQAKQAVLLVNQIERPNQRRPPWPSLAFLGVRDGDGEAIQMSYAKIVALAVPAAAAAVLHCKAGIPSSSSSPL